VVIERFHPLKKEESIAKYSLKQNCLAFEQKIAQKKKRSSEAPGRTDPLIALIRRWMMEWKQKLAPIFVFVE
jgi:hypothetical protein